MNHHPTTMPIGGHPRTSNRRWPLADAEAIASQIVEIMRESCVRIEVAGSIRRRRESVGDIEIVYSPRMIERQTGLFAADVQFYPMANDAIDRLIGDGILKPRRKLNGSSTWGELIKLATHIPSGIPVDLFAISLPSWHNYLVCRTGPAESNMLIATMAQKHCLKWEPYSAGFRKMRSGEIIRCNSEAEVFRTVGLPYKEPRDR